MQLLLFAALSGCKSADDDLSDTQETGTPVETGTLAGTLNYPGSMPPGAKLHIAIKADVAVWTAPDYREAHDNPTMPFSYNVPAVPGIYFIGAFLDLTNDSPGGPASGDPKGVAHDDPGPTQHAVIAKQTTEVPPIDLRVPDQEE